MIDLRINIGAAGAGTGGGGGVQTINNEKPDAQGNINVAVMTPEEKEMVDGVVGKVTELDQKVGEISELTTEDKSSLVAAINELVKRVKALEESGGVKATYDEGAKAIIFQSGAEYDEGNKALILKGGTYDEENKSIKL